MNNIKISIITVCFNSEKTILDTLKSVYNQTYNNIEHIIVDGKSKDRTVAIVSEFKKNNPSDIVILSESDKGIYDAMNKGVSIASGDIIGILNSDDFLSSEIIIEKIVSTFVDENWDVLYGNINYVDSNDINRIIRRWHAGKGRFEFGWSYGHASMYVTKELYKRIGEYKVGNKISSDYDYMLRINRISKELNVMYCDEYIATMRNGGESTKGLRSNYIAFKEAQQSLNEHNYKFPTITNGLRVLRKLKQFINY